PADHRRRAALAARAARRMSAPSQLRISGGTVYDPANGVDGAVRDVCIQGERIVAELPSNVPRLDARGMIVMPGGVDIHAHIAGSSVNQGRRLLPEQHATDPVPAPRLADGATARSGTAGTIPSTFTTGYRYAGLGYSTVMEAAVAPLGARHAPAEPDATPIIDAGWFVLPGNDEYLLRQLAHFTQLQFHSYGGERGKGWKSAALDVIEHVNAHPEISADVGQVMFGPATTLTADAPVEHLLYASTGRKWVNVDIELETGCGIVPYAYRQQAAVAALQWAVGLELFLLARDPWRVVLSTDHPNGGSFLSYPQLIRVLMDRTYRDEQLKRVNQKLLA